MLFSIQVIFVADCLIIGSVSYKMLLDFSSQKLGALSPFDQSANSYIRLQER